MKKCLLYIVSLGALAMASPLTLQEALDMAKSNNSQIKAEKAKVEMAESGQTEARSRFLPKISLSAGVTKINDPITIDLSDLQGPWAKSLVPPPIRRHTFPFMTRPIPRRIPKP